MLCTVFVHKRFFIFVLFELGLNHFQSFFAECYFDLDIGIHYNPENFICDKNIWITHLEYDTIEKVREINILKLLTVVVSDRLESGLYQQDKHCANEREINHNFDHWESNCCPRPSLKQVIINEALSKLLNVLWVCLLLMMPVLKDCNVF